MTTAFYMFILFLAKVLDNTLNTAKTILVQRNRCLLAGVALGLSNFIYLSITKDIVTSDSTLALVIVSIAQSRLIDEYIERSLLKCKRVIRKN